MRILFCSYIVSIFSVCLALPGCSLEGGETPGENDYEDTEVQQAQQPLNMGDLGSSFGAPVATGTTSGKTNEFSPACASSIASDVQYTWQAPTTDSYTFSTAGSAFDTILEVREFSNTSTVLGCNDDTSGTVQSSLTLGLTAGTTYLINIDGYGNSSGSYALNIRPTCVTLSPGPEGKDARIWSRPDMKDSTVPNWEEFSAISWTWSGVSGVVRSLIEFDLSQITSSTISSATLTLYGVGGHSSLSHPNQSVLKRITKAWNEDTVTWNTQPMTTDKNQAILATSVSAAQNYTVDVKAMVQDMKSDPANSHGFMLQLTNEAYYASLHFASGDNVSFGHPTLKVCW